MAAPTEMCPPTPAELRMLLGFVADRGSFLPVFLLTAAVTGARAVARSALAQPRHRSRPDLVLSWLGRRTRRAGADVTKSKRAHMVDVDPASFGVLVELNRSFARPPSGGGYVFSDDGGVTAWKPNRVTKAFLRHRRAAGLRHFRLHDYADIG